MAGYWRAIGSADVACQPQGPTIPRPFTHQHLENRGFVPKCLETLD